MFVVFSIDRGAGEGEKGFASHELRFRKVGYRRRFKS